MTPLQSLQSLLPFSGPPERRSSAQIDADLEDEFAFHLEMRTRDLIEEGRQREAASGEARALFGNIETIKRQCKQIALEEQTMLQRVNFVMMILVLVLVGLVGFQVFTTQRHNTLALQAITTEMTNMKYNALSDQRGTVETADVSGETTARILVEGNVAKPGWHEISLTTGTTIQAMLTRLNVRPDQWVTYKNDRGAAKSSPCFAREYFDTGETKVLRPNDELLIQDDVTANERRSYFMRKFQAGELPCCWVARAEDGDVYHLGRSDSISPERGGPARGAVLLLKEGSSGIWRLTLRETGLTLNDGGGSWNANWEYQGEQLTLDLTRPGTAPMSRSQSSTYVSQLAFEGLVLRFEPNPALDQFHQTFVNVAVADAIEKEAISTLNMIERAQWVGSITDEDLRELLDGIQSNAASKGLGQPSVEQRIQELFKGQRSRVEADPRWTKEADPASLKAALREFAVGLLQAAAYAEPDVTAIEVLHRAERRIPEIARNDDKMADELRQAIAAAIKQIEDQK